ncbi:LytTR family DNA-binding domain-containing protein [Arsukibacterium tuosuense]|uniref:LytTR family DNA-binding domain-containing protein n=1 Tax=Arsukibacterium tuosuense TaxID=1323745 RepID=UPI001483B149|nr:LytTR family DNA-binding domain-containing protein [Arsukibacterium tuosuense]
MLLLALFFSVNMVANGYIAYVEKSATGIVFWKPWLWEISSALSVLLILPGLIWLSEQYPLRIQGIRQQMLRHLLASFMFCALHLVLMVTMRSFAYQLAGEDYRFDWSTSNLLYEYAKDVRLYLFFIILFEAYRFVIRRWRGEASKLADAPDLPDTTDVTEPYLTQVLVKMLNQEFLIKLSQVDYIKTAGNYQDLYVKGRAYPFRITQSSLLSQLTPTDFVKINRGEIVNINAVTRFNKLNSNDARLILQDGTELSVHKNYIENIPAKLRVVEV